MRRRPTRARVSEWCHTALQAEQIRQIGVRSVDDGERSALYNAGIAVYDMRAIDESGMRAVMAKALEGATDNTHLHVSFDVDFLDPQLAPGVGTPVQAAPPIEKLNCAWK